ncbi:MAG: DNA polymerase IV [Thermoleophilia bacterium]|nr:DNA polymerase IV [Thermoleophilia bacterium]
MSGAGTGRPKAAYRAIAHLDLDAFYASVEENLDPSLREKPVIVGGGERGVVSTANYIARRYGVHSAMPMRTARRLCPQAVVLPGNHRLYAVYSRRFKAILEEYSPLVEKVSIDEAYIDLTGTEGLFGPVTRTCRAIQRRVRDELDLGISVGLATNKLVAKVASDFQKPAGFTVVRPGEEAAFLAPLPVEHLPGVGPSLLAQLRDRGVVTVGDLARIPENLLRLSFGEVGEVLARRARGEDPRQVTPRELMKSISRETTFDEDTTDTALLESTLLHLTEDVCRRLRRQKLEARTVTVKIRYSDFVTHTRSHTLRRPLDVDEAFFKEVLQLFRTARERRYRIRLLGVGLSNLVPRSWQDDLFDQQLPLLRDLDLKLDAIREKYGRNAIRRGAAEKE